ncbi:nuclease-related domain-containing protein [Bacillus methanolicus]|uniref:nuclease-related domain-containing protein n=1 Tax=Bacillus methanolicus TaxID=1471 RepID=UPI0023800D62|nr:nuclease-related domain-containing protein [Bacillus methanolicus]
MALIAKERTVPIKILMLEALLRRLSNDHPRRPEFEEELTRRWAGYRGELSLDYYLNFLPEDRYFIYHDLHLANGPLHFQMDTLILTANYALILEVKNFFGTINFEPTFNQFIRTVNDKEEGFPNPLAQVRRQRSQLLHWMNDHSLHNIPIEYLVVISNPSTIIKPLNGNSEMSRRILHSPNLLEKINDFEKIYSTGKLSSKDMRKLNRLLLKSHTPPETQTFQIPKKELITGVQCPNCSLFSMERYKRNWHCPHCTHQSKDAHVQAIQDYFLLLSPTITNKEFREFLHLSSRHAASKMLSSMNLPFSGENKGRIYFRPQFDFKNEITSSANKMR